MNKNFFKIGIIGFGNIGKKRYQSLLRIKKFKIQIDYIVDLKKPTINLKKTKYYKHWEEILNLNVDLVIVSTPTYITEKIIKKLHKKFNLIIEKPISTKLGVIKKLANESLNANKLFKVGYNLRFDDGLMKAKKNCTKDKIGEIYYIKITYANGAAKTNSNKVGSLLDMGTHSINILEWLIKSSDIKIVTNNDQKNEFLKKSKIDNGFIILKHNNILISLHHGFCTWKNKFELEVSGSRGFVRVDLLSKWGDQKVHIGIRKFPDGTPSIKSWVYKNDNSWKNELESVLNLINCKKKKYNSINMEFYNTLKIINKLL